MKGAKFSYQRTTQGSRQCIVIYDKKEFFCDRYLSVAEDIERVVDTIELAERIRAEDFVIVFHDRSGRWDGYNARTNKFLLLGTKDWPAAVQKYVAEELQPQHA